MPGTFVCDHCGRTSERSSEDEANAEALEVWGVENASERDDMAIVCDECWEALRPDSPVSAEAWRLSRFKARPKPPER